MPTCWIPDHLLKAREHRVSHRREPNEAPALVKRLSQLTPACMEETWPAFLADGDLPSVIVRRTTWRLACCSPPPAEPASCCMTNGEYSKVWARRVRGAGRAFGRESSSSVDPGAGDDLDLRWRGCDWLVKARLRRVEPKPMPEDAMLSVLWWCPVAWPCASPATGADRGPCR